MQVQCIGMHGQQYVNSYLQFSYGHFWEYIVLQTQVSMEQNNHPIPIQSSDISFQFCLFTKLVFINVVYVYQCTFRQKLMDRLNPVHRWTEQIP